MKEAGFSPGTFGTQQPLCVYNLHATWVGDGGDFSVLFGALAQVWQRVPGSVTLSDPGQMTCLWTQGSSSTSDPSQAERKSAS